MTEIGSMFSSDKLNIKTFSKWKGAVNGQLNGLFQFVFILNKILIILALCGMMLIRQCDDCTGVP